MNILKHGFSSLAGRMQGRFAFECKFVVTGVRLFGAEGLYGHLVKVPSVDFFPVCNKYQKSNNLMLPYDTEWVS